MSRPTLLLVHGAWHGSWAFEPLTSILIDRGWTVKTVDLPTVHADDKAILCACSENFLQHPLVGYKKIARRRAHVDLYAYNPGIAGHLFYLVKIVVCRAKPETVVNIPLADHLRFLLKALRGCKRRIGVWHIKNGCNTPCDSRFNAMFPVLFVLSAGCAEMHMGIYQARKREQVISVYKLLCQKIPADIYDSTSAYNN